MSSFFTGRQRPPAPVFMTAINGMQCTGTVRMLIKPTHMSLTQTIVFLRVMYKSGITKSQKEQE